MTDIMTKTIGAWQFWAALAGLAGAVGGIAAGIFARIRAYRLGLVALMRVELVEQYNRYNELRYCPIYARDGIEQLYAQYHRLGGNGTVTDLYRKIVALPTDPQTDKEKKHGIA